MDVLKYVDILIGLAIVMLLLSPLVTGITQLILYISDTRARFLGAGLRNLLLQLDYDAVRWVKVTNSAGEPVPNVSVSIPGMATLRTDANGRTKLSQTIPAEAVNGTSLTLKLSTAGQTPGILNVELTLTPHGKPDNDPAAAYAITRKTQSTVEGVVSLPFPPLMNDSAAREMADAVQQHPMIAKVAVTGPLPKVSPMRNMVESFLQWRGRKGEVVEREELIRILLEFAANEGSGADKLSNSARTILQNVLTLNNVPSPGKTLADIRDMSQKLEKDWPSVASHVRQTTAIITAAQSDFVGKINNWFDQTMDRVTERYALTARAWTVLAAAIVALIVQIDSLDLIRRLSVDDKFRASLLAQAEAQQKHVDDAAKAQTTSAAQSASTGLQGETESAKARRDEIEQNLAALRTPDLAILPDHFIWQVTPEASLFRNPTWTYPYPKTYELVAGTLSYAVTPRWKRDPLRDLQTAIGAANAPVSTEFVSGEPQLVLTSSDANGVQLLVDQSARDVLKPLRQFARTRLVPNKSWTDEFNFSASNPMSLAVGEQTPVPIQVTSKKGENFVNKLYDAIQQNPEVRKLNLTALVTPDSETELVLSALDDKAREITLRWNPADPFSNVLNETELSTRTGSVAWKDIEGHSLTVVYGAEKLPVKTANIQEAVDTINKANTPVTARSYSSDRLLLHSQRLGALELRYQARDATTNILDTPEYGSVVDTVKSTLQQRSMLGVLLSWILLSLGAPFWYDTLKDLLKLRPAIASKEEAQRNDRMTENKDPAPPTPKKDSSAPAAQ